MKRFLTLLALTSALVAFTAPAFASENTVDLEASQLLSDPGEWDGQRVTVTGELVGDYSTRQDGVWVQLNDDSFVGSPIGAGGEPDTTNTGIGARIPPDVFARIEGPPGRYGHTGPIVRLEGIFRHSDPALQGETYLAVEAVTTVAPTRKHPTPGPDRWLAVGGVFLSIAGIVLYTARHQRPPSRPGAGSYPSTD